MPRPKRAASQEERPTPLQEIERKIKYHEACIDKLKAQRERLLRPSRKQLTALLAKVEGMTMTEIADKLGISL